MELGTVFNNSCQVVNETIERYPLENEIDELESFTERFSETSNVSPSKPSYLKCLRQVCCTLDYIHQTPKEKILKILEDNLKQHKTLMDQCSER